MRKRIFCKIEQLRIAFRLFKRFCQQLYHKQRYGVLYYIKKNMLVYVTPFKLAQALQVMQFVMIGYQVKYGAGLKQVSPAGSFFRRNSYSIHYVRLYTEQLRENSDDHTGFAIFYGP